MHITVLMWLGACGYQQYQKLSVTYIVRKTCCSISTFHSKHILLMHNCIWTKLMRDMVAAALWNERHVHMSPDCVVHVSKCQTCSMCHCHTLSYSQKRKRKGDHLLVNSFLIHMFLWDPYISWSSGYSISFDLTAENITETLNYQRKRQAQGSTGISPELLKAGGQLRPETFAGFFATGKGLITKL